MNYYDLRRKVDEILSKYDNNKINSWFRIDEKRAQNENTINYKIDEVIIEKPNKH